TTVDQGAPCHVTLHADFDGQTFGSATIELRVPATGFAPVNVTPAAAFDEYDPTNPTTPLGSYHIGCARATGPPGAIDLVTIDAVRDGMRAGTYAMSATLVDALDVNEHPLPLLSTTLTFTVTPGTVGILTTAFDDAFETVPYQQTLFAQGGQPPYTWLV